MPKLYPFKYHQQSYEKYGKLIRPMNENRWFEEHQDLLLKMANHPDGRDLLCIDRNLPKIVKMGKNYVRCFLDIKGDGTLVQLSDFRVGAKWANVIRYRWLEFAKMAKEFYSYPEFKLHRLQSGLLAATVSTFYPDPDPESTSVDGQAASDFNTWDISHDQATGGFGSQDSTTTLTAQVLSNATPEFRMTRAFALFDTSSLPDGDTISAAKPSLWPTVVTNGDNDGDDWVSFIQTTPASNTAIVAADFNQCGAIDNPTEGTDRLDLSAMSTGAYEDWTMDATGRGWISKTGITKLGFREGHDQIDSPVASPSVQNTLTVSSADETGTSQDTKLLVTHAVAAGNPHYYYAQQ